MTKLLFWTPRVLAILFILFLALFSLDIFDGNYGFWGTVIGLFMHNIPSLILLIVLIIAWKREVVGGIVFTLAGFAYITALMISGKGGDSIPWYIALSWSLIIAGPALLVGALFLVGWWKKKAISTKG
ncbi:MAG: hypothetical protein WCV84_05080 [Patescibacteria group bacterium]